MKFAAFNRMPYRSPDLPRGGRWPLPGAHFEPELAKLMSSHPENEKLAHIINFDWWGNNLPMMQRRFQQWLQS